jgi:single-strand DNA-binding protein
MSNEPIMTVVGNLTADPELRFTPSGAPVVNFTVASTPRKKQGEEWVDGEPLFLRCTAWREMAENIAGSFQKGQRVIVHGRFKIETYEARDGGQRSSNCLDVDEIGHSVRFGTSSFTRTQGAGNGQQRQAAPVGGDPWASRGEPISDPWGSGPEEPPF